MVMDQSKMPGWAIDSMKSDDGPDQHDEHDRVLDLDPGVELLEGVDQRLAQDLAVEEAPRPRPRRGERRFGWRLRLCGQGGHQKNFPWLSCSTMGPSETAGKKVRPPMMTMTPMVRPTNMPLSVRKVPSDAGTTFLAASDATERQGRDHDAEPADQHVDGADDVVEGGVAGQAGHGRAVVVGLRGEAVEDLGEPVRTGVERAGPPGVDATPRWP